MLDLIITTIGIFLIFLIPFFIIKEIKTFNCCLQFAHIITMLTLIYGLQVYILSDYLKFSEEYYSIQKTIFLPIKNIKGIFDTNNDLTNLDFRTTEGIFSIVKNDEYSKECLQNYYIKQSSECPITDIILEKEKVSHKGYFEQKISDNIYLYYTKESKLDGKLYEDISIYPVGSDITKCSVNEFLIDNKCSIILFESNFNFNNVSLIIESEEKKKSFTNFINYSYYCDKICALLIILSFFYNCCTPKDNKGINLFRIITLINYFCTFILLLIRYYKYYKIKQYLNDSKNIDKEYLPKFAFNLDTIVFSFSIIFFIYLILYLIIPVKCHCCDEYFCDEIGCWTKEMIFGLILPINIIYHTIIAYEIINDYYYIRENYEYINTNWKQNSITSISISNSSKYNSDIYSLNNFKIEYKKNNYTYYDILNNNDNSKICGKDSQGNDLYFPKDVECPVNDIFISKFDLNEYDDYTKIKLKDEDGYLYYTNKKTSGKIVIAIIASANDKLKFYGESNYFGDDYDKQKEFGSNYHDYEKSEKEYKIYRFNTAFFCEEIYSWNECENEDSCSKEDIYKLYAINYFGVNNNLIGKVNEFKKNLDKFNYLCTLKYVSYGLNAFDFIYFSCIFLRNDVSYGALGIGIVFLLPMIFYIIINAICLNVNIKYVQHFLNKINSDFERNKCDSIWTFILNIIGIIFFFYYISIIVYRFLSDKDNNCLKSSTNESIRHEQNEGVILYRPTEESSLRTSINSKKPKKEDERKKKCKVCKTNEKKVIIYPCRHKCICQDCFDIINSKEKKCPYCRAHIIDGINIDLVYDV